MGSFEKKIESFIKVLIDQEGYKWVLEGLNYTLKIAILGLIIGIVIGTLIATVRVIPKYKTLPKVLNGFCSFYVAFFRGTPMVVQLLLVYYVLMPLIGITVDDNSNVAVFVFGLNSGAYISEIMRSGIQSVDQGQMEAARAFEGLLTTFKTGVFVRSAVILVAAVALIVAYVFIKKALAKKAAAVVSENVVLPEELVVEKEENTAVDTTNETL